MSTKIITGAYPDGYTLGPASRTLTITATGYVGGTGVSTLSPVAVGYIVVNDGRVREADSDLGNGLYLANGGKLTNGSASDLTAEIEGYRGVRIENASGAVTNFGTIIGDEKSGVLLKGGGSVINGSGQDRGALISGQTAGVGISGAAGTLSNFGTVLGEVLFDNGGTVTNGSASDTVATILTTVEDNGVQIGTTGSVTNFGTIGDLLASEYGVLLEGANLTNGSSADGAALIYGHGGIKATASSTIANYGIVRAAGGDGVVLEAGGRLTNGSSASHAASISGRYGVLAQGAGATVINYGVISGTSAAVQFGSASDEVIAEAGSTFNGGLEGGGGMLVISGGAGTIEGLGGVGAFSGSSSAAFSGFGAYVIGAVGSWALVGSNALGRGQTLTDEGAFISTGSLTEAAGASVSVASGGTVTFESGGGGYFQGSIVGAGAMTFVRGSDTLAGTTISGVELSSKAATLTIGGDVTNSATISINGGEVIINALATLAGGGVVSLAANPANLIEGGTLDNADRIQGAGQIDVASLVNSGTIVGSSADALSIATGAATLVNSGMIENTSTGGLTIEGAVANSGTLQVTKGTLTVEGSVAGAGEVKVSGGGAADLAGAFTGAVLFTSTGGDLVLGHSRTDTVTVSGFATTEITSIDLQDIAFTGATLSYSGTTSSGVLTVKSGAEVASITLKGDYLGSTFTLSVDSGGGTIVTDPPAATASALVSAMAAFAPAAASAHATLSAGAPPPVMELARPA